MQQNEPISKHKQSFKEWLEKLQQESWQLELLISGFAIYGIYASGDIIHQLEYYVENNLSGELRLFGVAIAFILQKGWIIFFLNLLVHVILRGLWIGAIGLRYVSGEIDYKSLGYSEHFVSYLQKKVGSYDDFIERLEKMCSVIFAYTFLLFLLFVSMMLFILEVMALIFFIQRMELNSITMITILTFIWIVFFLCGLIVLMDFLTLGIFKRIKEGAIIKLYFPVYRFYSFITLSFLYRPLLYNFIDNRFTRKLFYLSLPYILIVIFGEGFLENNRHSFLPSQQYQTETSTGINPDLYEDLRQKSSYFIDNDNFKLKNEKLSMITLEQFEITKPVTSFFIRIDKNLEQQIENSGFLKPFRRKGLTFSIPNKADPYVQNIESENSAELKSLYEQRRNANRDYRKNNDEASKNKADSLRIAIDSLELLIKYEMEKTQKLASEKILKTYLSYFTVYLDNEEIIIENCYFTRHPHNNEDGIRCYMNMDSLSKGLHSFRFIRKFDIKSGEQSEKSIYLPFIKL